MGGSFLFSLVGFRVFRVLFVCFLNFVAFIGGVTLDSRKKITKGDVMSCDTPCHITETYQESILLFLLSYSYVYFTCCCCLTTVYLLSDLNGNYLAYCFILHLKSEKMRNRTQKSAVWGDSVINLETLLHFFHQCFQLFLHFPRLL